MVGPADIIGLPTKVVQPIALFSNSELILYDFCVSHWLLTSHGVGAKAFDVHRSKGN